MLIVFLKIALPSIFTNIGSYTTVVTNAVIAGHMSDPSNQAAVGLCGVCCNVMVLSVMIGLNGAQETLASQAFGAENYHLCGIYLNRGRLILTTFFIPIALIPIVFGEDLFLMMGQDAEVSRLAAL